MERGSARPRRDGVLRLLSLELTFADERCAAALADEMLLAAMASFEAALARASAACGLVPAAAAEAIADVCAGASFDALALARKARQAGTLAIPFVKALTDKVAAVSPPAARYVHFGATSQDVIDTAVALCHRRAAARLLELARAMGDALAELARRHAETPMLARTLLQPAAPVPFGWKAAMWLAPLSRSLPRLRAAVDDACVLQFGGASGTLAAFGERAGKLAERLAAELKLERRVTWHSSRDAWARYGAEMAILCGISAKIAGDVALLMQAEVGEAAEPAAAGRGGSSSMPHKRNPAISMLALEAGRRAPGLAATLLGELQNEHERGIGQWQSQWMTLRELSCATASATAAMVEVLGALVVNPAAMRANIEETRGLVFSEALALRTSRKLAERLCAQAANEKRHLREVVQADAEATRLLSPTDIDALFEPRAAYGAAAGMTGEVLSDWAKARESAP
ncbi:MAG: 3-carboxy-cis,cis-muconate cycloisomerase [Burkholderiales bacterium]